MFWRSFLLNSVLRHTRIAMESNRVNCSSSRCTFTNGGSFLCTCTAHRHSRTLYFYANRFRMKVMAVMAAVKAMEVTVMVKKREVRRVVTMEAITDAKTIATMLPKPLQKRLSALLFKLFPRLFHACKAPNVRAWRLSPNTPSSQRW